MALVGLESVLLNSAPQSGARAHESEIRNLKQWLIFAVKAAVSGLLVWWLLERTDLAALANGLDQVSAGPLTLAFAAFLLAACLLAVRWTALNRLLGISLSGVRALRLTWIGLFFNQTLPSTIGGDVARVWFVYRSGVPMSHAASSIVLDRLCALAALILIVAVSLPASSSVIADPTPRWSLPLLVALGVGGFVVLYAIGGKWGAILSRWPATRVLVVLALDFRKLMRAKTGLVSVIAPALAIHLTSVLSVWLIGQGVAAEISFLHCLVLVPPVLLISMLPISIAGWGVREGAMIVAFGFVGVSEASALIVSLILGIMLVAVGAPGGLLWFAEGSKAPGAIDLAVGEKDNGSGPHDAG
jgi:uncharacterized membrane protein YbhN (UPF0104 family)